MEIYTHTLIHKEVSGLEASLCQFEHRYGGHFNSSILVNEGQVNWNEIQQCVDWLGRGD